MVAGWSHSPPILRFLVEPRKGLTRRLITLAHPPREESKHVGTLCLMIIANSLVLAFQSCLMWNFRRAIVSMPPAVQFKYYWQIYASKSVDVFVSAPSQTIVLKKS